MQLVLFFNLGGQTTKVLDKGSVKLVGPYGLEIGSWNPLGDRIMQKTFWRFDRVDYILRNILCRFQYAYCMLQIPLYSYIVLIASQKSLWNHIILLYDVIEVFQCVLVSMVFHKTWICQQTLYLKHVSLIHLKLLIIIDVIRITRSSIFYHTLGYITTISSLQLSSPFCDASSHQRKVATRAGVTY